MKSKQGDLKDIQAYLNYYAIVGDDDGGKMMSQEEFEAYKKKIAPIRANHLYVYYTNNKGEECKAIGPSSLCFCKHRYRNHNFDNITNKKVNCKNCDCKLFNYIPVHGSQDIKCSCHHSYEVHDPVSKKCIKCNSCSKFSSNYICDCGLPYNSHYTLIQTRKERIEKGKQVDEGNNLVGGIGGLTSYSSITGANYKEFYNELLEGNELKGLPQEYKNMLGDGNENNMNNIEKNNSKNSGNNNKDSNISDLFNKPNKFAKSGKEYSISNKGKK